jgi:hypothetical protein
MDPACFRHGFGNFDQLMGKATAFWKILEDSFSILRIKNIRINMFGQSMQDPKSDRT